MMKRRSGPSEAGIDVTKHYARLSFRLPPDQVDEFEAEYQERLVPVLKNHGLAKSSPCERPAVEGIFSRLFEVGKPSEVVEVWRSLWNDPVWREVLRDAGMSLRIEELTTMTTVTTCFLWIFRSVTRQWRQWRQQVKMYGRSTVDRRIG